ncbi:MAG: carbohydrate ABC transporter permease [Niameybacter sp.]|uniref:carbohydrate ABC transporter permease n=1 Tax=Niameybacter sp. TaxID=2033640 RepID=UPI002FC6BB2D
MIKKVAINTLKYGSLLLWSFVIFFPLITLFFGSFKTYNEFTNTSGLVPPVDFFNFENYKRAFVEGKMLMGFVNTFILILLGVGGSILLGSMVAYVINRFDFKFKKMILFAYLLVSIVPLEITQVGTFKLIHKLGLYNSLWAPTIIYLGADVLMVYIYLQALDKVPKELDKAALLEGASYLQIYRKVIFPLLKPATATIALLKMIAIYNDFYIPYLYMPGEKLNTVSTTIYRFVGPNQTEWHVISAAIIMSMIPMLILFFILQKYIYQGITAGSIR